MEVASTREESGKRNAARPGVDANASPVGDAPHPLLSDFLRVRRASEALCAHLEDEDLVPQSMPDTSPAKWHLAHTAWFFETFVLAPFAPDYRAFHPSFGFLFNSYYNAVGERHARPDRGLLTRPTRREVGDYRAHVDGAVTACLQPGALDPAALERAIPILRLGLHHEQQHQELILTDLKHLFSCSALAPAYRDPLAHSLAQATAGAFEWIGYDEGLFEIGHPPTPDAATTHGAWNDATPFAFDNEGPRHRVFLHDFALADRLVTNAEFLAFIEDDGYRTPSLWLDRGWATVCERDWSHPFYWRPSDAGYSEFTLAGLRDFAPDEPVSHLSLFEADAFARWAGARLPSEAEWETAVARDGGGDGLDGSFVDDERFHPSQAAAPQTGRLRQAFGDLWEWTRSSYGPYPGFSAESGALGEYNGKFMCEQNVLRGGSCATSRNHIRDSYRNFFYAPDRWQFTGLRLAKDL